MLAAAILVGLFGAGWPDILIAVVLLMLFLRSAIRVFGASFRSLRAA